ncbi:MAG: NifB/NifX family molybdenum-iron cluster-binding protein [Candidatus Bathyarchaeota archaeon]|nr:NifB/NifX family molybdenum-iron cluster-binding protein [Candidatus Bathyarchaeum sp.]
MGILKIAVATNGTKGLDDAVSDVFGRANTFTILDAKDKKISGVTILENSAVSYHHGAGPIAVKMLVDAGVQIVLANELGIGASDLLKQHNITFMSAKPGTNVQDAVKQAIHTLS